MQSVVDLFVCSIGFVLFYTKTSLFLCQFRGDFVMSTQIMWQFSMSQALSNSHHKMWQSSQFQYNFRSLEARNFLLTINLGNFNCIHHFVISRIQYLWRSQNFFCHLAYTLLRQPNLLSVMDISDENSYLDWKCLDLFAFLCMIVYWNTKLLHFILSLHVIPNLSSASASLLYSLRYNSTH